jgi:hypothetical protein
VTDPFPPGFFERQDESPDPAFYGLPRLVTHIDDGAIDAVGQLYEELGIDGSGPPDGHVLDLMSSWISHLRSAPAQMTVLGLNQDELDANPPSLPAGELDEGKAFLRWLADNPSPPRPAASRWTTWCGRSGLQEVAQVLCPGGPFVVTSATGAPTKAIRGWLANDDHTLPHRGHLLRDGRRLRRGAGRPPGHVGSVTALRRVGHPALNRQQVRSVPDQHGLIRRRPPAHLGAVVAGGEVGAPAPVRRRRLLVERPAPSSTTDPRPTNRCTYGASGTATDAPAGRRPTHRVASRWWMRMAASWSLPEATGTSPPAASSDPTSCCS